MPKDEKRKPAWQKVCVEVDRQRADQCAAVSALEVKPSTVLDPFGGSGTTGVVSDMLGRDCLLIELNPTYARMARKRIRESLGRVQSDMAEDQPEGLPLFQAAE